MRHIMRYALGISTLSLLLISCSMFSATAFLGTKATGGTKQFMVQLRKSTKDLTSEKAPYIFYVDSGKFFHSDAFISVFNKALDFVRKKMASTAMTSVSEETEKRLDTLTRQAEQDVKFIIEIPARLAQIVRELLPEDPKDIGHDLAEPFKNSAFYTVRYDLPHLASGKIKTQLLLLAELEQMVGQATFGWQTNDQSIIQRITDLTNIKKELASMPQANRTARLVLNNTIDQAITIGNRMTAIIKFILMRADPRYGKSAPGGFGRMLYLKQPNVQFAFCGTACESFEPIVLEHEPPVATQEPQTPTPLIKEEVKKRNLPSEHIQREEPSLKRTKTLEKIETKELTVQPAIEIPAPPPLPQPRVSEEQIIETPLTKAPQPTATSHFREELRKRRMAIEEEEEEEFTPLKKRPTPAKIPTVQIPEFQQGEIPAPPPLPPLPQPKPSVKITPKEKIETTPSSPFSPQEPETQKQKLKRVEPIEKTKHAKYTAEPESALAERIKQFIQETETEETETTENDDW